MQKRREIYIEEQVKVIPITHGTLILETDTESFMLIQLVDQKLLKVKKPNFSINYRYSW